MLCHFIFCVYGCSFWILKEHEGSQETGCLKGEGTAVLFQCHVFFFFFKTSIPTHFASHTHHINIQNLSFTNPRQTHQVHSFSQQTTTATTKNTPKRIYIFIWHYGNHNVSTYWLHRCFLFFFSVSALSTDAMEGSCFTCSAAWQAKIQSPSQKEKKIK